MSRSVIWSSNAEHLLYELYKAHPNFVDITTPSTSGQELAIAHDLGRVPKGAMVVKGDPDDHTGGSSPVGTIIDYVSTTPPTGFLECDGSAVSRTTYADLFAVISTTYGAGDGSTTFNLPDFRGRSAMGRGTGTGGGSSGSGAPTGGSALTARTIGNWLGEETHTLTTTEMPSHTHTVTDPGHAHGIDVYGSGSFNDTLAQGNHSLQAASGELTANATTGITIANSGSGGAHNTVQPVVVVSKMIRYLAGSGTNLGSTTTWTDKFAYMKFLATSRALTVAFF